jgi:hypothetical protein
MYALSGLFTRILALTMSNGASDVRLSGGNDLFVGGLSGSDIFPGIPPRGCSTRDSQSSQFHIQKIMQVYMSVECKYTKQNNT